MFKLLISIPLLFLLASCGDDDNAASNASPSSNGGNGTLTEQLQTVSSESFAKVGERSESTANFTPQFGACPKATKKQIQTIVEVTDTELKILVEDNYDVKFASEEEQENCKNAYPAKQEVHIYDMQKKIEKYKKGLKLATSCDAIKADIAKDPEANETKVNSCKISNVEMEKYGAKGSSNKATLVIEQQTCIITLDFTADYLYTFLWVNPIGTSVNVVSISSNCRQESSQQTDQNKLVLQKLEKVDVSEIEWNHLTHIEIQEDEDGNQQRQQREERQEIPQEEIPNDQFPEFPPTDFE